jgi:hypothetical protein
MGICYMPQLKIRRLSTGQFGEPNSRAAPGRTMLRVVESCA